MNADRVADAAAHALAVGGVGDAAGELAQITAAVGRCRRQRHRAHALEQLGDRRRLADHLTGRHSRAGPHRVGDPQLDRVDAQRRGELVHLRLVGDRDLDGAEPAHRAARRVVGVGHVRVDARVGDVVGPGGEARRVRAHGRRARGVGTAVEHDPRAHVHEPPVGGGAVLVAHPARVAVDVAEERLLAVVDHPDRAPGVEREHAGMDLHRQVLAAAERPADAAQRQAHLLGRQVQAQGELVAVDVQPLRGDVEVDAALAVRDREARLGAEERLVLHADLVLTGDDDVGVRVGVAVDDPHVAQDVPRQVELRCVRGHRPLRIGQRLQHVVVDLDRVDRAAGRLRVVGGDDRDRLALVANVLPGEHRLVGALHPVQLATGDVLVGEHRAHARDRQRARDVERPDVRARVRAAQRRAPQHPVHPHVRGVLELALDLRDAVGSHRCVVPTTPGRWISEPASALSSGQLPERSLIPEPPPWRRAGGSPARSPPPPAPRRRCAARLPRRSGARRRAAARPLASRRRRAPRPDPRCPRRRARRGARARRRRACRPRASRARRRARGSARRRSWRGRAPARAVSACGPPASRANCSAARISDASPPSSFEAAPSTPRPTGTPAPTRRATGAIPAPSRAFEFGQWATPVPVAPKRAISASSRCTQCASQTSSPSQPSSSR